MLREQREILSLVRLPVPPLQRPSDCINIYQSRARRVSPISLHILLDN